MTEDAKVGAYTAKNERTKAAIKDALLALLEKKPFAGVSVTELAAAAGVSRSTFYAHFRNTREVFDAVVRDFHVQGTRGLRTQLHCADCGDDAGKRPLCEAVRDAGKYQALVADSAYLSAALAFCLDGGGGQTVVDDYCAMGLSPDQARIIALFQLSGCYAVATASSEPPAVLVEEWHATQQLIDTFIRGGVQAVRSARLG